MPGPGRPPKPTHLKVVTGTARADRMPKNEPKPPVEVPSCPTWLHPEAKREWRRIVKVLEPLKLITHADRAALATYCEAYATWWEATRAIRKHGMTQVTDTGYVAQRPEVGIRNTAWKTMRTYLGMFGLSPSDRAKLGSLADEAPPADPADEFFKIG